MSAAVLAAALVLDAALGEPRWLWHRLPHPAVVMGRAIGWCDTRFNSGAYRQISGAICVVSLMCCAMVVGWTVSLLGPVIEALIAAVLLAQRSLVDHVRAVGDGLRLSLGDGRRAVARIVSRDTRSMTRPAIARAAVESAAENLSDGVVAPAFWFLLGGLPGLLVYKMVNTADSMIGYRSDRYERFGKTAARLDDVMNWIPARLTALLIAVAAGGVTDWSGIASDARRHRSPNAGWPEAVMARVLHVALAGPRSYDGQIRDLPYVYAAGARDIGPDEIDGAVAMLWRSWAVMLMICVMIALF